MSPRKKTENQASAAEDARLKALGYEPQFERVLGLFADFSLGYSYMSPMAGLFALFATALAAAGPPFFWTMIVVLAGQSLVCLVFAEAASEYPIAGGVYQWARRLGGMRWGFLTAWIYLLALVGTAAGIASGGAPFLAALLGVSATPFFSACAGVGIAAIAVIANFVGTRVLAKATEIGVWAGLAGLAICGGYMLLFARVHPFSILFDSYGLAKAGYAQALLYASLIGIWILFGFEACGDLAEEVEGASHKVPKAMMLTILCGGASTLLMTLGLILAVPDINAAIKGTVADPAGAAISQALGPVGMKITLLCLLAVVISATASVIASTSRLLFALGRDGMIFGAKQLAVVERRRDIPVAALATASVMTIAVISVGFVSANAATQIISFATTGIYASFQMVVLASLFAGLKGWRPGGAFRLGGSATLVKLLALAFGVAALVNLAWPRPLGGGWFANWLIVISMGVIILLGLLQLAAKRKMVVQPAE